MEALINKDINIEKVSGGWLVSVRGNTTSGNWVNERHVFTARELMLDFVTETA
ncbi:conserved hypothetical protein [Vibrio phage 464E53-1]|nr:conserved hypothetical protein [Vibrio phage 464E53-1]